MAARRTAILALAVGVSTVATATLYAWAPELRIWWSKPSDTTQVREAIATADLEEPGPDGPDVVLIVLDTLRRDAVGAYTGDGMPRLTAWSEDSRVFDEARSVSSWTLPAHASLFTGQYPITHGAHRRTGENLAHGLGEVPTLATSLGDAGWATVGIAANTAYLHTGTGLSRGFDAWLCESLRASSRTVYYATADRVTDMALDVLSAPRERPVFLFLNYADPHGPTAPPAAFLDAPIDPSQVPYSSEWKHHEVAFLAGEEPLDPDIISAWKQAYDGEVAFLDHELGRLLEAFPSVGIDEDDLVVILSDHGEYFGEHDLLQHDRGLYAEGIDIPLIARGPGFPAGRDDRPVQTQDIARWVLEVTGRPPLPDMEPTAGMQVAELYSAAPTDFEHPVLRERFDRLMRAFIDDSGAVHVVGRGADAAVEVERGERGDLVERGAAWVAGHTETEGTPIDVGEEERRALEALGYMD